MRMPAANDYLQNQFLPDSWKGKNTVSPKSRDSRYAPLHASIALREVLCLKEHRTVNRDHTLSWNGTTYELRSPLKYSIYKQKIELRTYQDLTWRAYFAEKLIDLTEIKDETFLRKAS